VALEMLDDPGGVGTCSGGKDRKFNHGPKTTPARMKEA
jgi:hypothetical protein